jgi:hypothetical protein
MTASMIAQISSEKTLQEGKNVCKQIAQTTMVTVILAEEEVGTL